MRLSQLADQGGEGGPIVTFEFEVAGARRRSAGEQGRVGIFLVGRGQLRVHIEGIQPCGFCAGNICFPVVSDHEAIGDLQFLLLQQRSEEADVRLAAAVVRGDVDAVELLTQAKVAQFIGGEGPLGIAQQPQPIALLAQHIQRLQNMRIEFDILDGADAEQLGGIHAEGIGILRHTLGHEQLRHNLLEGDVGEAFVALPRLCLPGGHGGCEGRFQFGRCVARAVKAEIKGGFFPNKVVFLGVDVDQCAV